MPGHCSYADGRACRESDISNRARMRFTYTFVACMCIIRVILAAAGRWAATHPPPSTKGGEAALRTEDEADHPPPAAEGGTVVSVQLFSRPTVFVSDQP